MTTTRYEVRAGAYYDSIVLMQLQKGLAALPGVTDAGVVMATPANCEVLRTAGFDLAAIAAQPDDLLIVIKGADEAAATAALGQVDALLQQRRSDGAGMTAYRPKSLAAAAKMLPEAEWVLISIPGRFAAAVADEALDLGRHVFLYSDNVPLDDEIRLKRKAQARGLLVMGPDCGTAIINGIGLGFANRVRRGALGLVAASGTGLQAVASQIHNLGGGVSQAIGAGGRDLKDAVGGLTTRQGLQRLADDPHTTGIILISKPPSPTIAADLLGYALTLAKPVVVHFIGYPPPARRFGNLWFSNSLGDAAELGLWVIAADAANDLGQPLMTYSRPAGFLRALFSGGTLAYEATLALQAFLTPMYSNTPVGTALPLEDPWRSQGHTLVDMGDDVFTQGRLHPMLDNDWRIRRLREESADPTTGLILLDIVLGEGAHPDPARELAPVIAAIREGRNLPVAALVIGTDADPQQRAAQMERLQASGAQVYTDPSACFSAVARALLAPPSSSVANYRSPFSSSSSLVAINIGLESFYDSLIAQGAAAVHVDWRPPAGGNERLMALLARLKK